MSISSSVFSAVYLQHVDMFWLDQIWTETAEKDSSASGHNVVSREIGFSCQPIDFVHETTYKNNYKKVGQTLAYSKLKRYLCNRNKEINKMKRFKFSDIEWLNPGKKLPKSITIEAEDGQTALETLADRYPDNCIIGITTEEI